MQQQQGAQIGVTLGCVLLNACTSDIAQAGINVAGSAIFAKFSRDDEAQADEVGVDNVVRAGISPRGIPEMFQILLNERQRDPGGVELWFQTHPTEESRISDTERKIEQIDPAILSTLTVNVHERAPLVNPTPGDNVMTQAFRNAWRNFVLFLASLIQALGWLIPAAALTTVAVIVVRRYLPRAPRALPKAEAT
jgi:predicted Zn-dependent protease